VRRGIIPVRKYRQFRRRVAIHLGLALNDAE
jgi:hypothetical protein